MTATVFDFRDGWIIDGCKIYNLNFHMIKQKR